MTLSLKAVAILAAVELGILGAAGWAVYHWRRAAYDEHLNALNITARGDSTRHALEGDLAVARRQAEQLTVSLDQQAHDAQEKGVALAQLKVQFVALARQTMGVVTQPTPSVLRVVGHLDVLDSLGVAVRAQADITVTPPPPTAAWTWSVDRAPLLLTIDFSCHRDTALVHVAGPRWSQTDVTKAVQDPSICNPRPHFGLFAIKLPSVPVAAALVALGWVLHR